MEFGTPHGAAAAGGRRRRLAGGIGLVVAAVLAACAGRAPLPAGVSAAQGGAFHAVNHGWHVGLVVARADLAARDPFLAESLPAGRYLELGWGDARYYREAAPGVGLALRAALWPTDSVLHVAGFEDPPARFFAGLEVLSLEVAPEGYGALLDHIAGSLARSPDGRPVPLGAGWYGASQFFEARGAFHACNTCNTWAARAAARAGLPVTARLTFTAGALMEQLRRAAPPHEIASGSTPPGR